MLTITKDTTPEEAYAHALNVIQDRWPEAEPIIQQNREYAYYYANGVIKGRWPEAEPTIMQNSKYALCYATDVIQDRWPEAEATIQQDAYYARHYTEHFFPGIKVVTKQQINNNWLWEKNGAIGFFAPKELFKPTTSILDTILETEVC
jgi:hypothetical protein